MKRQIPICIFIILFTVLSNLGFASAYSEKDLIAQFDKIVTVDGKVSVSAIRTIQNKISDFTFDKGIEALTIVAGWEGRSLVLNMGHFEIPSYRTFDFDYEHGTLKTTYNYINKLGRSTVMTLTFKTAAITRLNSNLSQSDSEALSSSSSEKFESEDLSDLNLDDFFSNDEEFLQTPDLISTPEISSDSEGEERQYFGVNKFVKTTFKKLNMIRSIGMHIRTTTQEYDHLWTTASAGSAALGYAVDAVYNFNVFSAVYAVGYGAVAVKSGKRSYDAYFKQSTTEALELLKNIDESRRQIEAFSTSTVEMMTTVGSVLEIAKDDASKLSEEQARISQLIKNAVEDQKKDLESVLAYYEVAQIHAEDASRYFAEYKKHGETITQAWSEINQLFADLKSIAKNSKDFVKTQKDPTQFFEEQMAELLKIIEKIQEILSSINNPMQVQNELALAISNYKKAHDMALEEASKILTTLMEKSQKKVQELTLKLEQTEAEGKKLSESLQEIQKELAECKRNQEQLLQASRKLEKNASALKAEVENMYRKQDILIGVAVGLGFSIICPMGAVGIACVGLTGMEVSHFCHYNENLLQGFSYFKI